MHRFYLSFGVIAGLAATVTPAIAGPYDITTISIAGSTLVEAYGINAGGQVVGTYQTDTGGYLGFQDSGGTISSLNVGGGNNSTGAVSINDSGTIVGTYNLSSGNSAGFSETSSKVVTRFSVPTAYNANGTVPIGINASGVIAGYYVVKSSGKYAGFLDNGGSFTSFSSPYKYTIPSAINASGAVVGSYYGPSGLPSGFLYSGGTLSTLSNPDALPTGINDSGAITGTLGNNGFIDIAGVITQFSASATAVTTDPTAINASGEVVGYYVDGSGNDHGFVDISGVITELDVPGAVNTEITAVNGDGTVVGYYTTSSNYTFGFIATPSPLPEPGSIALLLTALAGVGFVRMSRSRAPAAQ